MQVLPDRYVSLINNLELLARQVVEGFLIGLHKSPFHGFSVEFSEHRLYNPGESTRHIDWRVFARTDRLYTKKYEEETNLRCQLVLDCSSSMYFPEDDQKSVRKIDFSVMSAAAIMYLLRRQRDAFSLATFSDQLSYTSETRSGLVHYRQLLARLAQLRNKPSGRMQSAAAAALHELADKIHRRSLVVIFTDFLENMDPRGIDALFSALQHLRHNKHEVIVFFVADYPREVWLEYDNRPYRFVDLESGEQVKVQPRQVQAVYQSSMQELLNALRLRCAQYRVDLVEADISRGFEQVLLPFLVKRQKAN
ncbi:MAG: DUF58 domain-containing protein [Chitinophagales bacterium]|nr:DUF58 domain-containing protein [Chitinophagales bacterium]MDW8392990.1 DUF58 domain-containing protein [Chitinophagales bacterium]